MFCFNVPTHSVAAIIGFSGKKLRDTEKKSDCKIRIEKKAGKLSLVFIEGTPLNCNLAKDLIFLSISHFLAAQQTNPRSPAPEETSSDSRNYDLRTFNFEVSNLSNFK